MKWVGALVAVIGCFGCGEPVMVGSNGHAIIGGESVTEDMYPVTGALVTLGQVSCTGTLIAPSAVLTAGHCVSPLFIGGQVPGFTLDIDGNAPDAVVTPGLETIMHPDFDILMEPEPGLQVWNDIGVLLLAEPIDGVVYERLPEPVEVASLVADVAVDIVGYGMTEVDGMSFGVKTRGLATLVEVGTHELLIGSAGEQQNCNGDSGGPAYLDTADGRLLVGVVSRSPDSDPTCDHGGIDTRVDVYTDWIKSVVPELCEGPACQPEPSPEPAPEPEPEPEPEDPTNAQPGGCAVGATGGNDGSLWLVGLAALALRRRRRGR